LFFGVILLVVLAIFLPPSALVAYLMARRLAQRLEALAAATRALRAGDLSHRVPLDTANGGVEAYEVAAEVTQVQRDFNVMAADLAVALSNLQAERDTVAMLLTARRKLFASVAHDLRTPLATMRIFMEALVERWEHPLRPATRQ